MDLGNGLHTNLLWNKASVNRLEIQFNEATDIYRMRFYCMTISKHFEIKMEDISVYEGVYCDIRGEGSGETGLNLLPYILEIQLLFKMSMP